MATIDSATSFNLVDKPWIKARDMSGTTVELSLREVFHEAHGLQALSNDLPTQDFAILRVLLAVLQRSVVGMAMDYEDDDKYPSDLWGDLWDEGQLPLGEIDAYLDTWHHRFELFDPEVPFMQVAGLRATNGSVSEIKKLMADAPDGLPLFGMRSGAELASMGLSEAARWLVHVHAFDTSGIKTGVVGDSSVKGGKSYPIGTGWAGSLGGVFLEGSTLRQTLMLNLCLCADCRDGVDEFCALEYDLPVWEQEQKHPGDDGRRPNGYADLYTWQSRRVLLCGRGGEVDGILLTNGDKLDPHNMRAWEPMTSWRRSRPQEKKLKIVPVYLPCAHQIGRALWRGLTSVLPSAARSGAEDFVAPGVTFWVGHLGSADGGHRIKKDHPIRLRAVGFVYGVQSAVFSELVDDSLLLSAFLLSPEGADAVELAKKCLEDTEQAVGALGLLAARIKQASGIDPQVVGDTRELAKAEAYYELDACFRAWIARLGPVGLREAEAAWHALAKRIIGGLGKKLVDEADALALKGRMVRFKGGEAWMSAGKAESLFWRQLAEALPTESENEKSSNEGEVV